MVLYAATVVTGLIALALLYEGAPQTRAVALAATNVCSYTAVVLAMVWLYAAWRGVPPSHRGTVSPRRAAFSLLIPLYNAYWGLAVNLALCDTLNAILREARSERRAPRAVAATAAITWLGSSVFLLAMAASHRSMPLPVALLLGTIKAGLWLAYMALCEPAFAAVAALGDRLGTPRLPQLQREPGPSAFVIVGGLLLIVLVGLACWQSSSPASGPRAERRRRATRSHASSAGKGRRIAMDRARYRLSASFGRHTCSLAGERIPTGRRRRRWQRERSGGGHGAREPIESPWDGVSAHTVAAPTARTLTPRST